ncbi:MAG: amidohydrolase family protein [Acidobacteriota bacterium]|nr:amidohydrolase family protein [Acidobacteriota bacterium]
MTKIGTLLLLSGAFCWAQVPVPAPPQEKPIMLVGGTAHLGNGQVIENAVVAFKDGKLTAVADQTSIRVNRAEYDVVDTTGKHIYPGFILPVTSLGLSEVNSVRATNDVNETGNVNPNVRSLIAYNTDSELIPTMRFNGILTAQITPGGRGVRGTSSIVQLDAWNWEDAAYRVDDGIHVDWPARMRRQFDFATFSVKRVKNENYQAQMDGLRKAFNDAVNYRKLSKKATNLKLEAMEGLFTGEKTLFIHTDDAKSIVESVSFAKESGVKSIAIVGGEQALMAKQFLVEHDIPVVLSDVHARPTEAHGDIDEAFKRPALLHEAGVRFCLSYGSRTNSRNLAFYAGTAVAYGLPYEEAVKAITLSTAQILGIDKTTGSLETGKDATLFVSSGDALDMRGQNLEHAFIQGRKIQIPGRQQALFERYRKKYGHE